MKYHTIGKAELTNNNEKKNWIVLNWESGPLQESPAFRILKIFLFNFFFWHGLKVFSPYLSIQHRVRSLYPFPFDFFLSRSLLSVYFFFYFNLFFFIFLRQSSPLPEWESSREEIQILKNFTNKERRREKPGSSSISIVQASSTPTVNVLYNCASSSSTTTTKIKSFQNQKRKEFFFKKVFPFLFPFFFFFLNNKKNAGMNSHLIFLHLFNAHLLRVRPCLPFLPLSPAGRIYSSRLSWDFSEVETTKQQKTELSESLSTSSSLPWI